MEIKKSFKADLRNKRGLLLEIGLVVALSLVIVAFTYTPDEYRIQKVAVNVMPVDVDIVPVTTDSPKQKPQKVEIKALSQLIEVIPNHRFVQTDLTFEEFDPDAIVEIVPPAKDEDFADDTIFITAETMPSFQDGDLNTFRAWVQQNVKFPQVALENRIQGRVVLSFVIDKDGRLTNIEVLQSPDRSLSEEAIRVLNKAPKWSPGKQRNQAVRVKYTLPVDFRVQN